LQNFFATDPNAFCPQPTSQRSQLPNSAISLATAVSNTTCQRHRTNKLSSLGISVSRGYEYEVENVFLTSVNVPHARRNNQAGFLDFRYRPHPRASLNFGGRAEANANFGTRVVPAPEPR